VERKLGGLGPTKDNSSHKEAIVFPPCNRMVSKKLNI